MGDYFVVVDGQVEGPKRSFEIERMARSGQITADAQMSKKESPDDWFLLQEWRPELVAIISRAQAKKTTTEEQSQVTGPRLALRANTAYPKLRGVLTFFAFLDFIGTAVFIILIFCDPEHAPVFVTCSAACLLGLIPLALSNVLIDIADIGLKKMD